MKHSEIRDRIIETASALFYQNGYNATGINEIIAESGIAKATLYAHFKSKEDVCIAYLRHKDVTFMKEIGEFARSKEKGVGQVLAVFDFLQQFFEDQDFNGCWCLKTVAEIPKDNERVKAEIQWQKERFLELIKNLVLDNVPDSGEVAATSLAKRVYLLYEGALSESHLHKSDWPIQEAKDLCAQILKN
ncbi:MAG: TetR/AcrR family transcriptional regulator [Bacteroidota bacterium]